jgi:hypothetical protein
MLYRTILLHHIQELPHLYDRLLKERTLLTTLDRYAGELRESYQAWQRRIRMKEPAKAESQIASEAIKLALVGLKIASPSEPLQSSASPLTLSGAIAFLNRQAESTCRFRNWLVLRPSARDNWISSA